MPHDAGTFQRNGDVVSNPRQFPKFFSRVCDYALAGVAIALLASSAAWGGPVLPPLENVQQVSGGGGHTCAVIVGGGARCWGSNSAREVGSGGRSNQLLPVVPHGMSSGIAAIGAGTEFTCVLTTSGGVRCWGLNFDGQLGNGNGGFGVIQPTPTDVSGLTSGVVAISTGTEHSCALTTGGGVKCWGRNNGGQLGDGTTIDRFTPVDVSGLTQGVASISTGDAEGSGYTCAVTTIGGLKCWGNNESGQLGEGSTTDRPTPTDVIGLTTGVAAVDAGHVHTCALTTGGGVKCWGGNGWNRLGASGFTEAFSPTPLDVTGLGSGVTALSVRVDLACALTTAARAKCWGVFHFPVGGVFPVFSSSPVDQGPTGATAVSVGGAGWSLEAHACARTSDARLHCWGGNQYGQLGNGNTAGYNSTPSLVLTGIGLFADGFE